MKTLLVRARDLMKRRDTYTSQSAAFLNSMNFKTHWIDRRHYKAAVKHSDILLHNINVCRFAPPLHTIETQIPLELGAEWSTKDITRALVHLNFGMRGAVGVYYPRQKWLMAKSHLYHFGPAFNSKQFYCAMLGNLTAAGFLFLGLKPILKHLKKKDEGHTADQEPSAGPNLWYMVPTDKEHNADRKKEFFSAILACGKEYDPEIRRLDDLAIGLSYEFEGGIRAPIVLKLTENHPVLTMYASLAIEADPERINDIAEYLNFRNLLCSTGHLEMNPKNGSCGFANYHIISNAKFNQTDLEGLLNPSSSLEQWRQELSKGVSGGFRDVLSGLKSDE